MEITASTVHLHSIISSCSNHFATRYEFMAGNPGTHFWHAHTGLAKLNGIHGSVVIREPLCDEPNSKLYDVDSPVHVIVLSDWMHEMAEEHLPGHRFSNTGQRPESILINGRGRYVVGRSLILSMTESQLLHSQHSYLIFRVFRTQPPTSQLQRRMKC